MGNPRRCTNCNPVHSIYAHKGMTADEKSAGGCAIPECPCPQFQPEEGELVVAEPAPQLQPSKELDPAVVAAVNSKKK